MITNDWIKVADILPINLTDEVLYFVVSRAGKVSGFVHQLQPDMGCDASYPVTHNFDQWLALPKP